MRAGALAAACTACGEPAVLVEVRADDLSVPDQLDAFCLAVSDDNREGGEFGQRYRLPGQVDSLPQTLAVEPGTASTAEVLARGYSLGREVARDSASTDFSGGDVVLTLARCPAYEAAAPTLVNSVPAPGDARIALSAGRGGTWVVGVASGENSAIFAARDQLVPIIDPGVVAADPYYVGLPTSPEAPEALVTFDGDGDCDDDLLIVRRGQPPTLWRREGARGFEFNAAGLPSGAAVSRAAAAGDLDGDGDIDLIVVNDGGGRAWINDGSGKFSLHGSPLVQAEATDATAVALGDVDGDGDLDLALGRGLDAAAPLRLHLNTGTGAFMPAATALPETSVQARAVALRDADGDGDLDLFAAAAGEPVRLFTNDGSGTFADASAALLPPAAATDVASLAGGDWTADCIADLVLAPAGAPIIAWRGAAGTPVTVEAMPSVEAFQVVLGDIDGEGAPDLLTVGPDGISWIAR